jgi:hypothetical protein
MHNENQIASVAVALSEIENTLGMTYPASAVTLLGEIIRISKTRRFREKFPNAQLLWSASGVKTSRENLPDGLLPFMQEQHENFLDIYAFDLAPNAKRFIVVWCDDAIVCDWSGSDTFLEWINSG